MEKPKKIDAIVFDCDGVLIDSEALLERVDLAFLKELGIPFTKDEYHEHFTGSTYAQNIKVIQDRHMEVHGQPVSKSVADDLSRARTEVLEKELTAIQGASEMLGILTLKKAVASNTTQNSWLRKKVTQVGLDHHFGDHIYAAENVKNGKPAPDLYLFAAKQLGVPPENCVAIEDSPRGVQAAVAAGMYTVGFSGSSHLDHATHEKKLLDAGAQQVFADMTEFQSFIEGLAEQRAAG